jgi:hypothetical protein
MRSRSPLGPHARDIGLRRLRRLTLVAAAAATALTGVFAGLAARAVPGRKTAAAPTTGSLRLQAVRRVKSRHSQRHRTAAVVSQPAPAPPPVVPAPTPAPPVVVSGGS